MKKIQYVIFDMDGLMFDTERLGMQAMQTCYESHGYPLTKDIYLEIVGTNGQVANDILKKHFGENFPLEQLRKETRQLLDELIEKEGLPLKPGLLNLLQYLKENKIPCAIASSTAHKRVIDYLKMAQLEAYFNFIIGGDEVKQTKPYPDIFLKALDKAQIEAASALVLEDSQNGIIASHKAHIPVICIPDMKVHPKEINDLCFAVLENLTQVIDILK